MYPVLLKIGPITVYSYGTFVAVGYLLAILLARKKAVKYGLDPDKITDLGLYVLIAGLAGARLLYVLTQLKSFIYRPVFDIFKIWEGGLVYYGGLIAGVIIGVWYIKKIKYPLEKVVDIVAPSIALGQFLGRIGCFLNGCCYGKVSKSFGLIFPNIGDNLPHIPTQLIESVVTLVIFLFLLKREKHKKFDGELFLLYLVLYSISRFLIEIIRADDRGPSLFGVISVSQFVSILIFILLLKVLIANEVKGR